MPDTTTETTTHELGEFTPGIEPAYCSCGSEAWFRPNDDGQTEDIICAISDTHLGRI